MNQKTCRCSIPQIQRYRNKISGPLLDRIDIHVEAPAVKIEELRSCAKGESSSRISERIARCRDMQSNRFAFESCKTNSGMTEKLMEEYCVISDENTKLLTMAMERLSLSARAYGKILKVSRTIADIECSEDIEKEHLLEAIQYRDLDRFLN